MKTNNLGLYVHIPFCEHICSYCDFSKVVYNQKVVDNYLTSLFNELNEYGNIKFTSIYIGGGTPSSLSISQLDKLLSFLLPYLKIGASFAFEANPENLTEEKIDLLKKYQVNRISLGVQSFNEEYLKLMNRYHDSKMVVDLINLLKSKGFNNINCDLIYGLPNQNLEDLQSDIEMMLSLPITHISTYSLSILKNTMLYIKKYQEANENVLREQYDYIVNKLEENQIYRYEVSNFAKKGYESSHNLLYWHNQEYIGIGLGAASYYQNVRYSNTKSLTSYLKNEYNREKETLKIDDTKFYYLMLNLRLVDGFELKDYQNKFHSDFLLDYQSKVKTLIEEQLLINQDGRIKVSKEHLYILDFILQKLLF